MKNIIAEFGNSLYPSLRGDETNLEHGIKYVFFILGTSVLSFSLIRGIFRRVQSRSSWAKTKGKP